MIVAGALLRLADVRIRVRRHMVGSDVAGRERRHEQLARLLDHITVGFASQLRLRRSWQPRAVSWSRVASLPLGARRDRVESHQRCRPSIVVEKKQLLRPKTIASAPVTGFGGTAAPVG